MKEKQHNYAHNIPDQVRPSKSLSSLTVYHQDVSLEDRLQAPRVGRPEGEEGIPHIHDSYRHTIII